MSLPTKLNKVVSMQLSSIELPIVFYNISESIGNNYMYIRVNYNAFCFSKPNTTNIPPFTDELMKDVLLNRNEIDENILAVDIETETTLISEVLTPDILCQRNVVKGIIDKKILIIPDGNYNAKGLINTINNLLSPLDDLGNLLFPRSIFSYLELSLDIDSNNSGTGKVILAPTKTHIHFVNSITLDFTKNRVGTTDTIPLFSKLGWNLGFIKPNYEGSKIYLSDTIINMDTLRYIYLAVDDFNNNANNQFISIFNKSILNPNILARISIKGTHFSSIKENNFTIITEPRQYFGPVDIQRLKIQIYDEYGRILNLNNGNYSFCLDFKLMYDL
jgi:hypothetical protein